MVQAGSLPRLELNCTLNEMRTVGHAQKLNLASFSLNTLQLPLARIFPWRKRVLFEYGLKLRIACRLSTTMSCTVLGRSHRGHTDDNWTHHFWQILMELHQLLWLNYDFPQAIEEVVENSNGIENVRSSNDALKLHSLLLLYIINIPFSYLK